MDRFSWRGGSTQLPLYAIFSRFSRLPPAFILPIVDAAPTTTVSSVLFDFDDVSGPPTNEHRSMVRCGRHLLCIKHKHYILHDLCGSIKHDTVLTFHPRVVSHIARSKKLTKFDLLTQRWTHTKVYIFLCIVYVLQWTRPQEDDFSGTTILCQEGRLLESLNPYFWNTRKTLSSNRFQNSHGIIILPREKVSKSSRVKRKRSWWQSIR